MRHLALSRRKSPVPQCGANICHLANGSFRINDVSVFESKQKCHETFLCAKLCLSVLSILVAFFSPSHHKIISTFWACWEWTLACLAQQSAFLVWHFHAQASVVWPRISLLFQMSLTPDLWVMWESLPRDIWSLGKAARSIINNFKEVYSSQT